MRIALTGMMIFALTASAQTERAGFLNKAKSAFDREMARERAGGCQKATTTLAMNECYGGQVEISTENYKSYAAALRALLAGQEDVSPDSYGPTGRALTRKEQLANFDEVETAWAKYRDATCAASRGLYQSGTIVNVMGATCELMLIRSHMRELNNVYGEYFSH